MYPHKYAASVAAAREGIRLLDAAPGVSLRAFGPADWDYVASLCEGEVSATGAGAAVSAADAEAREALDAFVARSLEEVTESSQTAGAEGRGCCVPCDEPGR